MASFHEVAQEEGGEGEEGGTAEPVDEEGYAKHCVDWLVGWLVDWLVEWMVG